MKTKLTLKIHHHNKHLNKSLIKLCKQLSAKIGAKVGYELEKEYEYSWEYIPMITLLAPCGCCYDIPSLRYDDKDIISKLIKLRDADKIVRDKIEEYQYMYGIYFNIKTDEDWNKSSEQLANEIISQYDNEIEEELGL
jgi:hypothetical protein